MAGVSDEAFRTLCLAQGADLTYTEMVSAKGLSYANTKTRQLLNLADGERKVAVQLFGHEPAVMASQAAWVEDALGDALAYIDINMGCPARKIVTKGDGSALIKTPELAAQIVAETARAVHCSVTVKMRRGWAEGQESAPELAKRLEQAGAGMFTVHGRYALQYYRGNACWEVITRVKDAVSVPVVGNGDVTCASDALNMIAATKCDAVMVGRAAQGNPWVFSEIRAVLLGQEPPAAPSIAQRLEMARTHARMLDARHGKNIVRMRKHAMWYMSGLPGAAAARARINYCVNLEDFLEVFDALEKEAQAHATRPL